MILFAKSALEAARRSRVDVRTHMKGRKRNALGTLLLRICLVFFEMHSFLLLISESGCMAMAVSHVKRFLVFARDVKHVR